MWNEAVVGAGDAEGFAIGHVVHMGRSWFRMTPTAARDVVEEGVEGGGVVEPLTGTNTMRIGLGRLTEALNAPTPALEEPSSEPTGPVESHRALPPGTVAVSWWSLVVLGASLLAIGAGAVAAIALLWPRMGAPAAPAAPTASAGQSSPRATVIVQPLAPAVPKPPADPLPAADLIRVTRAESPARTAPPPPRRPRPAPEKQPVASAPTEPATPFEPSARSEPAGTKWVDPFAD